MIDLKFNCTFENILYFKTNSFLCQKGVIFYPNPFTSNPTPTPAPQRHPAKQWCNGHLLIKMIHLGKHKVSIVTVILPMVPPQNNAHSTAFVKTHYSCFNGFHWSRWFLLVPNLSAWLMYGRKWNLITNYLKSCKIILLIKLINVFYVWLLIVCWQTFKFVLLNSFALLLHTVHGQNNHS